MAVNLPALEAMLASGATAEMIVAAVRAMMSADEAKAAIKRERNASRMRVARATHSDAQRCTVMHGDAQPPPPSSPLSNPLSPSPAEGGGGGGTRAREERRFAISSEALDFATEMARIAGHDPEFLPPLWVSGGPATRVQMYLDNGWLIPVMREAAQAAMRKKRDGPPSTIRYFEKIFARAMAPQLPLPVVQIVHESAEVVHVTETQFRSGPLRGEGFAALARRRATSG